MKEEVFWSCVRPKAKVRVSLQSTLVRSRWLDSNSLEGWGLFEVMVNLKSPQNVGCGRSSVFGGS